MVGRRKRREMANKMKDALGSSTPGCLTSESNLCEKVVGGGELRSPFGEGYFASFTVSIS